MADKCPSCNAPVDGSGKFQDLPADKYPRSYAPDFEKQLAMKGAESDHGSPGATPGPKSLPSAGRWFTSRNDNIQAGELATSEESHPTSYPHVPTWGDRQREAEQGNDRSIGQKMLRGAAQRAKK